MLFKSLVGIFSPELIPFVVRDDNHNLRQDSCGYKMKVMKLRDDNCKLQMTVLSNLKV